MNKRAKEKDKYKHKKPKRWQLQFNKWFFAKHEHPCLFENINVRLWLFLFSFLFHCCPWPTSPPLKTPQLVAFLATRSVLGEARLNEWLHYKTIKRCLVRLIYSVPCTVCPARQAGKTQFAPKFFQIGSLLVSVRKISVIIHTNYCIAGVYRSRGRKL